ncbi:uncharacterized protein At3g17950-like isoform X1 [Arachis duranensis]|uniref:Uncharacterized protein At3g17950-like isoform X1 n=1 Tax=Arachis duranensis TaxID=130453 RepID=A0A6P4DH08_ARADU|nr:uncharacterized protein At3g17950-like isoform X1 [Arachis duranensis]
MLDPAAELVPPPYSPTNSSISSSDLDTESTGSFFHDRSTTLGTLMGVSFPAIAFRAPSQHRRESPAEAAAGSRRAAAAASKKKKKTANASAAAVAERRRRWWQLCRDGDSGPASLGDFLEVERRFGDVEFYGAAAELEGIVAPAGGGQQRNGGRVLFADGRVLPPEANVDDDGAAVAAGSLCNRFPVSLAGICSGGAG